MGNLFFEICCGIIFDLILILTNITFLIAYFAVFIWDRRNIVIGWISVSFLGVGLVLSIIATISRIKDKKNRILFKVLSWIIGSAGILIGYPLFAMVPAALLFTLVFDCVCTIPSSNDAKNQAINAGEYQGQFLGQFPGQYQGPFPGQYQGPFPGQYQGQFPENVQPQPILNSNAQSNAAKPASETNYVLLTQTTEKADGNSNINN